MGSVDVDAPDEVGSGGGEPAECEGGAKRK